MDLTGMRILTAPTTVEHPHRVTYHPETDTEPWRLVAHCDAPVGAPCRLWCAEGCEEDGAEEHAEHELVDQGQCITLEWLRLSDVEDFYAGPDLTEFHDGPIRTFWDFDGVQWEYATTNPTSDALAAENGDQR